METCSQEHARRLHSHEQRAQEQYAEEQRWKQLQAAGGQVRHRHHSTKRNGHDCCTAVRLHPVKASCMQRCHQQTPKICWRQGFGLLEKLQPSLHALGIAYLQFRDSLPGVCIARCHTCTSLHAEGTCT